MLVEILTGGDVDATPRLRLPANTIRLRVTDAGVPVANATVVAHIMEGGGAFPTSRGLASEARDSTDPSGEVGLPEFILGPEAAANRILVHADHAHVVVTVRGNWAKTEIVLDAPAGPIEGVCHEVAQCTVLVRDRQYPNAPVAELPLGIELKSGGGWLERGATLTRAAVDESDDTGRVYVYHRMSAREETSVIRAYALEGPTVPELLISVAAHRPRLLSSSTAARSQREDPCANGFLSKPIRLEPVDSKVDVQLFGPRPLRTVEVLAEEIAGASKIFPGLPMNARGADYVGMTIVVRPPYRSLGAFDVTWKARLPDFPDDPPREIVVPSEDRYSGPLPYEHAPDPTHTTFVETDFGGVRDDDRGVELEAVAGDVQYIGPNATSSVPWEVRLLTKPLSDPDRRLRKVKVRLKVRMTPDNSISDDPTSPPDNISGTIAWASGGGAGDELRREFDGSPGQQHSIAVNFTTNEHNFDQWVELTAVAVIAQRGAGSTWTEHDETTTLLARAVFFHPRVYLTRKDISTGEFVAIDDRAILPAPAIDERGRPRAHSPQHEVFVELRCHDVGAQMEARVTGGTNVTEPVVLKREVPAAGGGTYTLYRSGPVICFLERPDAYAQQTLPVSSTGSETYAWVNAPFTLRAMVSVTMPNNPRHLAWHSAERPVAFLDVVPTAWVDLRPTLPRPRLEFPSLNSRSNEYAVVVTGTSVQLRLEGEIHDAIGDITEFGNGRIQKVEVAGPGGAQSVPVTPWTEDERVLRPFAWRGTFTADVPLVPGVNVVDVKATNPVGGVRTRTLWIDLIDPRNDYDHPDASVMKARVRVMTDPWRRSVPELAIAHYRSPHFAGATAGATSASLTVESLEERTGAAVLDSFSYTVKRVPQTKEVVLVSRPWLPVPESIDATAFAAARAAGVPVVKHRPGGRLRARGSLPYPVGGSVEMQAVRASYDREVQLLVEDAQGNFVKADRIPAGRRFTFDVRSRQPEPLTTMQFEVMSCDRLGRWRPGPEQQLTNMYFQPGPTSGWLRLQSPRATATQPDDGWIVPITRSADAPAGDHALRVYGGGSVVVSEMLGAGVEFIWPVEQDPVRQQDANGRAVAQDSPRATSARAGIWKSVVARTGEFLHQEQDAALHGRGLDLHFFRSYRSFTQYDGPMGEGWTHSLDVWLRRLDSSRYLLVEGNGRTHTFVRGSSGVIEAPIGIYARLEEVAEGVCRLRETGGGSRLFIAEGTESRSFLPLRVTQDACGNRIDLDHDQAGTLVSAADPLRQRVYLRYEDAHRVEALGDFGGRRWDYFYHDGTGAGSNGDLESVVGPRVLIGPRKFPDGKTHRFGYKVGAAGDPLLHKLETLQDPAGDASAATANPLPPLLTVRYDAEARVTNQDADGVSYEVQYPSATERVLFDGTRHETRFQFPTGTQPDELSTLPETFVEVDGGQFVTRFQYNDQTELIRIQAPLGSVTELEYDHTASDPRDRGNLLVRRRRPTPGLSRKVYHTSGLTNYSVDPASTEPAELVWRYTYEPRFQKQKTVTDPAGYRTELYYDYEVGARAEGNLVQALAEPVTAGAWGGGPIVRMLQWEYNNFGQTLATVDENGVRNEMAYYPADMPNGGPNVQPTRDPATPGGHLARIESDARPAMPGRSRSLVAPKPIVMLFGYDQRGEIYRVRSHGRTTTTVHNELGQLIQRKEPDGLVETFTFDVNDHMVRKVQQVRDVDFPTGATVAPPRRVVHTFEYDRLGKPEKAVVDQGNLSLTTTREYDAAGRLEIVRSPVANVTLVGDPHRFTKLEYDGRGRVVSETHAPTAAVSRQTTLTWDDEGRMRSATDGRGRVTEFRYDAWGREREVISPDGTVRETWRDAVGALTGRVVTGSIDGTSGYRGVLSHALWYRDEGGRVTAVVEKAFRPNASGGATIGNGRRTTRYERDAAGLPVVTHTPRGLAVTTIFTGHGRPARVSNPRTGRIVYGYDAGGQLESMTAPAPAGAAAVALRRTYDKMGRLATVDVPGGARSRSFYDTLGRLRLSEDPLGNRTYYEYDGAGRRTAVLREMRATGRRVDPATGMENALLTTIRTDIYYDRNDNVELVKDADGNEALRHTYNSLDERETTVTAPDLFTALSRNDNPGPETASFTYWPDGTLATATSPDGVVVSYDNDGAGHITSRVVSSVPVGSAPAVPVAGTKSQRMRYDGLGRCVYSLDEHVNSVDRCRVEREFDSFGNLWQDLQAETYSGGVVERTTSATFDDKGDMDVLTYDAPGVTVGHHFDNVGRLSRVPGWLAYSYDKTFLRSRSYIASDLTLKVEHDAHGRVVRHRHVELDPAGTILRTEQGERIVEWAPIGSPGVVSDDRTGTARVHLYDSAGQNVTTFDAIAPAALGGPLPVAGNTGSWNEYDRRGNPTIVMAGAVNSVTSPTEVEVKVSRYSERVLNPANEVGQNTERVDPTSYVALQLLNNRPSSTIAGTLAVHSQEAFYWDRRGNLRSDGTRDYEYDAFDRLIRVVVRATGAATDFHYDALGRRLAKGRTRFLYHGERLLEEIPGNATWRKRYIHGAEGILAFSMLSGSGQLRHYYLHEDRTGTIKLLSRRSGSVVERYGYDAAGLPALFDPTGQPLPLSSAAGNPFLQHGQYYDGETGLYYVGSRYYHPGLQRMLQRDPLGLDESASAYTASRNNLQGFRDPSGVLPVIIGIVIVGAIVGLIFGAAIQIAKQMDRTQVGFDVTDLLLSMFWGAVLAPFLVAAPWLLYGLAAYSLYEMGKAINDKHWSTAVVYGIGALLSFAGARAPRSALFAKMGENDTFVGRFSRLFKSRAQIAEEIAAVVRAEELAEEFRIKQVRRRSKVYQQVYRIADRLGVSRENVHFHEFETRPNTYSDYQPAWAEDGHVHIDIRYFDLWGRSREARPEWVQRVRSRYTRLSALIAHEVSHNVHDVVHYGLPRGETVWGDASFRAIDSFWFQQRLISEACARTLVRSIAPEMGVEYGGRMTLDVIGEL